MVICVDCLKSCMADHVSSYDNSQKNDNRELDD